MTKAVLYCRVSTLDQKEEKTIARQLDELREHCKKEDYKIVKEYRDEGVSGTKNSRPAIDQLKEDAKKHQFEIVLITELDRVARDKDGIDAILFERELDKSGVEVHYLDGSDDKYIKWVKRLVASVERENILKRTKGGRIARANRGSVLGGRTRYGYRYVKKMINGYRGGVWKEDEQEGEIVNLIMDSYLRLGSERQVIKELTARGVKPRYGEVWRRSTMRHILKCKTYGTGITYYGDIEIKVPVIVDKEKFEKVQKLLRANKRNHFQPSKYLLGGLLKCFQCGSTYSGEVCKGKRYYRCNNRHKTFPEPRTCNAKMILADDLEKAVWDGLNYLMENPKVLQERIEYLNKDERETEQLLNEEKASSLKEIKRIEKKKDKLLDNHLEGIIGKEKLSAKIGELSETENRLRERLEIISSRLVQLDKKPLIVKNLKEFCELSKAQFRLFSFKAKQEFLRYITKEITYNSETNEINITGYIPITPEKSIVFAPSQLGRITQHQ